MIKHAFYNHIGDGPSRAIVQDVHGDWLDIIGHSHSLELHLISDEEMAQIAQESLELSDEEIRLEFSDEEIEEINRLIENSTPAGRE